MALLTGGAVQQWEVKTMRLWLIRSAGKLTKGSRQLTLKLPEKFLHPEEWRAWGLPSDVLTGGSVAERRVWIESGFRL